MKTILSSELGVLMSHSIYDNVWEKVSLTPCLFNTLNGFLCLIQLALGSLDGGLDWNGDPETEGV